MQATLPQPLCAMDSSPPPKLTVPQMMDTLGQHSWGEGGIFHSTDFGLFWQVSTLRLSSSHFASSRQCLFLPAPALRQTMGPGLGAAEAAGRFSGHIQCTYRP